MVVIRNQQMSVFDEEAKRAFIDEIVHDLIQNCPSDVGHLSTHELHRRVADGLLRASSYGLKKKYSLALFIELQFLAAPDFDAYPPIRYILTHPGIPPDDRLDKVVRSLRESDWEIVRRRGRRSR